MVQAWGGWIEQQHFATTVFSSLYEYCTVWVISITTTTTLFPCRLVVLSVCLRFIACILAHTNERYTYTTQCMLPTRKGPLEAESKTRSN